MATKQPEDKPSQKTEASRQKSEPKTEKKLSEKKLSEKKLHDPGTTDVPKPKADAPKPKPKKDPAPAPASKQKSKSKSVVRDEPVKVMPKLTLDVFLLAKGVKPDQTAGFRRWMKNRKVRRQTMPEWEALWKQFHTRPMTNRR